MAKRMVGKYEIIEKLAQGGMGAVFKAKHPTLKRLVILKQLILKSGQSIIDRFTREARLMLDFRNEHIVQVFDHFKEGGSYFIAMEYIDGLDLDKLIQKKRYLSNEAAILIFTEICKGLIYAHDKNVVHRDIKPANVLISNKGEVKLTDFGIATSKDDSKAGLTAVGMTLGTPAYMSPEQIMNTKGVDKRADIYSMGVILYKMVTGAVPFPGNMSIETINLIKKGKYKLPRKINPHVFPNIQAVIKKLMHCKKKKRYKNLKIVIAKFDKFLKKFKNQEMINHAIKSYMGGGEITAIKGVGTGAKGSFLRKANVLKMLLAMGLVLIGGYFFYHKGLYFDLFLPKKYGAVKVKVKVYKKHEKLKRHFFHTKIFSVNKKGKVGKKAVAKYKLRRNFFKEDKKYNYYESPKIYLIANRYKIDVDVENKKYVNDLIIKPRIVQKKSQKTRKQKEVVIPYSYPASLPLNVKFNFKDIDTNRRVEKVKTSVYRGGWMKWKDFLRKYKGSLKSGKKYYFSFKRKDYYTKNINVSVDPYQTELNLNVSLVPRPGNLYIKANKKGLSILLDNSNYYYKGGQRKKYIKILPTATKNQKITLAPGRYKLTVKQSNSVIRTEKINILPNKAVHILVKYDKKKKSIKFVK